MKAHWSYLIYVLTHKYWVFIFCMHYRVSLWQAVIHDWVKFLPVEWTPYVRQFYNADGSKRSVRDSTGNYDPNKQKATFKRAWLHHQKQPHHWQAWISIGDNGSLSALSIPEKYVREMVADWRGAGRAQGHGDDIHEWYGVNKDKMILHDETRALVESLIGTRT